MVPTRTADVGADSDVTEASDNKVLTRARIWRNCSQILAADGLISMGGDHR